MVDFGLADRRPVGRDDGQHSLHAMREWATGRAHLITTTIVLGGVQTPPARPGLQRSGVCGPTKIPASDGTQFETSLDIGPDIRPRIAMTDKGYDSHANRAAALARGITPVIPRRENSKQRGRFFPKRLYKLRARVEQAIGKLKRFKRVAMRCEKTDISYSAIISFACGLMLVKSVHTA